MPEKDKEICGIIMPISAIDGLPESHWEDVKRILVEVIESAGFKAKLVSDGEPTGIIHNRIVQNLYENPIVICDVSCRNPNVMFELGMRLTFDKPTVIIKDDQTNYAFDASPIEHIPYPRDLRYTTIEVFKGKLKEKVIKTKEIVEEDPQYSTFLRHFGEFKIIKPETVEVGADEYIFEELRAINKKISNLNRNCQEPLTARNAAKDSQDNYSIPLTAPDTVDARLYELPFNAHINLEFLQGKLNEYFLDHVIVKQGTKDGKEIFTIIVPMYYVKTSEEAERLIKKAMDDSIVEVE